MENRDRSIERWIIRGVAALCAGGGLGLAWAFGVFLAIPLRDQRLLAMSRSEAQIIGIALVGLLFVAWGAQHLLAMADAKERPRTFRSLRAAYALTLAAAALSGAFWSLGRVVVV